MNTYALVYAYFKIATKNTTPRDLAEQTGKKVYREAYGKVKHMEYRDIPNF